MLLLKIKLFGLGIMSATLFVCPSVCLSACWSDCLSVGLSVGLSVCLSVCLSAYLFVCLSINLQVWRGPSLATSISESTTPCIPLVFKHFSFCGPMAEECLTKISKKSKDEHGRNKEADFGDRRRKQLSVVVQSCNSYF